jgi:4-oxalmesaconate hydratase
MGHHIGNEHTSMFWSQHCNDLVKRVCDLYPSNFIPGCQLPQSPGAGIENSVTKLRRCVEEMGFVGFNLNPDPTGGFWTGPPLGDRYWYPIYETMTELDVPAMIHVSAACNPHVYTTGSHYLGADTTAFQQLLMSDVLTDFPTARFIIPHGGGAVPYHWGRFRGMVQDQGKAPLEELVLDNIFFDTCVYHQPGIDLLVGVIPTSNILFASEMVGAVRGDDPATGQPYDHTRRYLDAADLTDEQRSQIFEGNVRRVYPRLGPILDAIVQPAMNPTPDHHNGAG